MNWVDQNRKNFCWVVKIKIYQVLVEKVKTYVNWVEQNRTVFCWVEKFEVYQNLEQESRNIFELSRKKIELFLLGR